MNEHYIDIWKLRDKVPEHIFKTFEDAAKEKRNALNDFVTEVKGFSTEKGTEGYERWQAWRARNKAAEQAVRRARTAVLVAAPAEIFETPADR